ncbi:MAG: hypothetical protein IKT41_05795 [Clostridia bacterium]|nr:hypothetical protein [Clostridia bacterium]
MRRKDVLIIVASLIIITFLTVVGIYWALNSESIFGKEEIGETATTKKTHHANGWETAVVDKIIHDIPIPVGFTYIEGNTKTGVIIKDNKTEEKYIWIPYQEVDKEIYAQVLANIDLEATEEKSKENIKNYGGFYVALKEGADERGEYKKIGYREAAEEIVEMHEVTLEEAMLINQMVKSLGLDIKVNELKAMTLCALVERREDGTTIISSNNLVSKIKDENGDIAYIPKEFEYQEGTVKTGLKIKDGDNLSFIWIPVELKDGKIIDVKAEILKQMEKTKIQEDTLEIYKTYADDKESEEYKELVASIEKYGGFYISETELGYDQTGKVINKYRNMHSTYGLNGKVNYVSNGDYYRNINIEVFNEKQKEDLQKIWKKIGEDGKITHEKAVAKSKELYKESETVVSHLTYGLEYDAAMLYLLQNCSPVTKDALFKDSTKIGKYLYEISKDKMPIWEEVYYLNGTYGLAGNLAEITQEKDLKNPKNIITRGGSWAETGNTAPMSSAVSIDKDKLEEEKGSTGFRTCLYIKTEYTTKLWTDKAEKNFAKGNGTEKNPYIIKTSEQLAYLAKIVNEGDSCEGKYFKIEKNIDLSGRKWTPIGKIETTTIDKSGRISPKTYFGFNGNIDGNGHKITGINVKEENGAALIGNLSGNGEVKNLIIEDGKIEARKSFAGGIVAYMCDNSKIEKCINRANITVGENWCRRNSLLYAR